MENTRGHDRLCSRPDCGWKVTRDACTTARNNGNVYCRANCLNEFEIKSGLGSVRIHRVKQYFTDPIIRGPFGPLDRIKSRRFPATVGGYPESTWLILLAARIQGQHNAL